MRNRAAAYATHHVPTHARKITFFSALERHRYLVQFTEQLRSYKQLFTINSVPISSRFSIAFCKVALLLENHPAAEYFGRVCVSSPCVSAADMGGMPDACIISAYSP